MSSVYKIHVHVYFKFHRDMNHLSCILKYKHSKNLYELSAMKTLEADQHMSRDAATELYAWNGQAHLDFICKDNYTSSCYVILIPIQIWCSEHAATPGDL